MRITDRKPKPTFASSDDFSTVHAELEPPAMAIDVFGPPSDEPADVDRARRRFRRMASAVHPDKVDPARTSAATAAFSRLSELWNEWLVDAGIGSSTMTITTANRSYDIGPRRFSGAICELYDGRYVDGNGDHAVLVKLPRSPANNDLLLTEGRALRQLANGDERFRPYLPELIESFAHRDLDTGIERQATVLRRLDGFVTLEQVNRAFPGGLDPRDAAWMWRRLLVALGFLRRSGVVHAAVLPDHVLIHPEQHGLVLIDFCYAGIAPSEELVAIPPKYRTWYPRDILATKRAEPSLDIYLAMRTMRSLLTERAPRPLLRFITGCTNTPDRLRPSDAWRLLNELDEILEDLYGPRRFRPFVMP